MIRLAAFLLELAKTVVLMLLILWVVSGLWTWLQ